PGPALLAGFPPAAQAQAVRSVFAGADPDIMAADGKTWIYPTGSGALFAWSSSDMVHWRKGPALVRQWDIGWIEDDGASVHYLWAPDMVAANARYYFYYSVGPQNPTPSRIGVATCDTPAGPCQDSGKPLVTGGDGFEAIDPAVFVDPASGTPYLYAGGSAGRKLRTWVLKSDMVTIDREVKVDTPPDFTEGAFMHVRNHVYYLSYSVGQWNRANYQVHYARSASPMGPWQYAGPILQSQGKFTGPGHHSFFQDPKDGQWYIAYHRWEGQKGDGPYSGERRVAIQKIEYRADGTIVPIRMN
ncbi:MAG: glycosyl hydrolase 43 family protein, partial [Sphingomonadales bacterium]